MKRRLVEIMVEKTGCTSPWVADQSNICRTHNESMVAFNVSWYYATNQKRTCQEPCRKASKLTM